jgi:hypothetical protein
MAKISNESIEKLIKADELMDFLVRNIYLPENATLLESEQFAALPDYAKYVILIVEFETSYEMQGVFTMLENAILKHWDSIINAFEQTNNSKISQYLSKIKTIVENENIVQKTQIRMANVKEFDLITGSVFSETTLDKIEIINKKLSPLIEEKDFWDKVIAFVDLKMKEKNRSQIV